MPDETATRTFYDKPKPFSFLASYGLTYEDLTTEEKAEFAAIDVRRAKDEWHLGCRYHEDLASIQRQAAETCDTLAKAAAKRRRTVGK